MGILADIGQVGAHEGKRLVFWPFFQLYELFDGFLVEKVAANTITGFGGITDYCTVFEYLDNLFDQAKLRVYRVDFKQHIVDFSFVRNVADHSYSLHCEILCNTNQAIIKKMRFFIKMLYCDTLKIKA